MKKLIKNYICVMLCLLSCLGICACGDTTEPELAPEPKPQTISQTDAENLVKQVIVNVCCEWADEYYYGGWNEINQLKFGGYNIEQFARDGDGWEVSVAGTYYPVDRYGDYGTKIKFDTRLKVYDDKSYTYYSFYCDNRSVFLDIDTENYHRYYW